MPWHELGVSWTDAALAAVSAVGIYTVIIILSRLWGQRQFATSSTYDLAFIFALGSIVGRVVLVRTSLATAVVGLVTMFALHALIGWLHHHYASVHRAIQNPPILLLAHGTILEDNLAVAHTSEYEVHEALRLKGLGSAGDAAAVILERNGGFTVIREDRDLDPVMFEDVVGRDHLLEATSPSPPS